jgi:hypothetical protein
VATGGDLPSGDEARSAARAERDAAAYRAVPQTDEEVAMGRAGSTWVDLEDETDWDALYEDIGRG